MDNLAVTSNSFFLMKRSMGQLSSNFETRLSEELKTFVGCKIRQGIDGLSTWKGRYVDKRLKEHGLDTCNGALTPIPRDADFCPDLKYEAVFGRVDHKLYGKQTDELLCFAILNHPEFFYPVCDLARSVQAPTYWYRTLMHRIFRYIFSLKRLEQH